jgi:hypothetical protein
MTEGGGQGRELKETIVASLRCFRGCCALGVAAETSSLGEASELLDSDVVVLALDSKM